MVILGILVLFGYQIDDQLAQQTRHFEDLNTRFKGLSQRRTQIDIAHLQIRNHANPMRHPRRQPNRPLRRNHQRLMWRLDPHYPRHRVQDLSPVMLVRFDIQTTRISARHSLYGDGGIGEIGRSGKGHGRDR